MSAELTPKEILKLTLKQYPEVRTFVGLFSGGKDSYVAAHMTEKLIKEINSEINDPCRQCKFKALHCKTGIGVKENFEFVNETADKHGWDLTVYEPEPRFSYEEIWRRYGPPHQGMHQGTMMWLKWFQIRKFNRASYDDGLAFVSGSRKKESRRRMKIKEAVRLNKIGEMKRYPILIASPGFYLPTPYMWKYMDDNMLKRCPVYETLHISGDCCCGAFAERGEAELLWTFHPETAKQIHALEEKYGGIWGRGSSMRGAARQTQLFSSTGSPQIENVVCAECFIDRVRGTR
jgi:3'-phosphoadenosine 5'-phosphosulfate sulfotransferase (PAPS reductase)/FAD synthetase